MVYTQRMSHLLALAACLVAPPADAAPPDWTPALQRAADANTRFTCRMLGSAADRTSTVCFSPLGLFAALSMAAGADDAARGELAAALQLPPGDDEALRAAGALARYYAQPRAGVTLAWESAVWGERGRGWRRSDLERLKADFAPSFHPADFAKDAAAEGGRINRWATDAAGLTRAPLLQGGRAPDGTRLALACGFRFRGEWADPFPPERTADAPLRLGDGSRYPVTFLHRSGTVRRFRDADVEVLELPLAGGEFSVVLVRLMEPRAALSSEVKLTPERLAAWLAHLREERRDDVAVPAIGEEHTEAFDDRIAAAGVRGIYQASRVRLSERGFECGAATAALRAEAVCGGSGYIVRPGLFLLRDARRGTILFAGRHLVLVE
jgi:serine protease inhibitor